jgi:dipeptidyl aminopeptidase/acylaminoacyl peptidase
MGEDPIYLAKPNSVPSARFDWYRLGGSGTVDLSAAIPSDAGTVVATSPGSLTLLSGEAIWRTTAKGNAVRLTAEAAGLVRMPQLKSAQRLYNVPPAGSWIATGLGAARKLHWLDGQGLHGDIDLPADAGPVIAVSRSTQSVVIAERDAHGVEAFGLRRAGAPSLRLAEINAGLSDVDATRILPITHRGPDGQILTSWLLLPPQRPGASPPPLVIRPYSGLSYRTPPHDYANERSFVGNFRALVGHGYAVLVPSLPLPAKRTDPMPGLADRILEVVAAAAKAPSTAGTFDPDRMALVGHSYGGYTVMAAIGQSDRFKAAISMSGLSDMFAKWHTLASVNRVMSQEAAQFNWGSGSVESGQDEMFKPPWADPARYLRNSPMYAVDRIKTPLLLFHGDQDVVTIEQSDAMFAALYREGKDAISVTYWGEGHLLDSPGNVRDMYARTFAFLDEHLAKVEGGVSTQPQSPAHGPANGAPRLPPPPP